MKRWARILLSLALLGMLAYLLRPYVGKLHLLLKPHPLWLAGMFGLFVATRFLSAEVMRAAVVRLGKSLGLGEAFLLTFVTSYANLLVPHAGLGAPAVYLKRRYGLRYADFGAVLMPMMLVQIVVAGAGGLVGTALLVPREGWTKPMPRMGLFAAVVVAGIAVSLVPIPLPARWRGRIATTVRRFGTAWRFLRTAPGLMRYVVVLHVAVILLRAVRLELAFRAVGYGGDFLPVFVASICEQFMLLISLTPGALGFREGAVVVVYEYLVGDPNVALAAALLDRIVMTVCILLIAQVGLWRLVRPAMSGAGREDPTPTEGSSDGRDPT